MPADVPDFLLPPHKRQQEGYAWRNGCLHLWTYYGGLTQLRNSDIFKKAAKRDSERISFQQRSSCYLHRLRFTCRVFNEAMRVEDLAQGYGSLGSELATFW